MSRIYGGIHVPADDGLGRIIGSHCGEAAWEMAQKYYDGSILEEPLEPSVERLADGNYRVRSSAARGLVYRLESSSDLKTFTPLGDPFQAGEVTVESVIDSDTLFDGPVPGQDGEALFIRFTRLNDQ